MSRIRFFLFIAFIFLVAIGGVWAYSRTSEQTSDVLGEPRQVREVSYVCNEGTITATYAPNKVTLLLSDGRTLTLPQIPAVTGTRYATADENTVFSENGESAFMEESGIITYQNCVIRDQGTSTTALPVQKDTDEIENIFPGTSTTSGEQVITGGCYAGGCSGQICSDDPNAVSTCEWREEYACYQDARCERQSSGECGWTQTPQLKECLATARVGSAM